jgi:hypothetical protein
MSDADTGNIGDRVERAGRKHAGRKAERSRPWACGLRRQRDDQDGEQESREQAC